MNGIPVIGIICGGFFLLLFGAIGILLIFKSVNDKKKVGASANWPSTTGSITRSSVAESVSTSNDDNITHYYPQVTYTYQVAGTTFEGKHIMFGAVESGSHTKAQATIALYPVGKSVSVYYNPADPKEAVLERQSKSSNIMLILGIVFLVMALCTLCIGVGSIGAQYLAK
jgi:hypothetical protein